MVEKFTTTICTTMEKIAYTVSSGVITISISTAVARTFQNLMEKEESLMISSKNLSLSHKPEQSKPVYPSLQIQSPDP